jgi:tRNA threonylcarbamoyladenosine biosynthesis protein TsaE
MNYYKGKLPIYHFDLYRLGNPKELDTLDFDEYFYGKASASSNGRNV